MELGTELTATIPFACSAEIEYTFSVLLEKYLGVKCNIVKSRVETIVLKAGMRRLELPATFFVRTENSWLHPSTLPVQPLQRWDSRELGMPVQIVETSVPVIYGDALSRKDDNCITLGLDIFGSAFYMLSRYEEVAKPDRDGHDRFPATSSLAYQEGFLNRPVVNEYVEILRSCLNWLLPGLSLRPSVGKVLVSCDVDLPYSPAVKSMKAGVRQLAGDLFKRRSITMAAGSAANIVASRLGDYRFEPFDTFEWMMDVNEAAGNCMTFFVIVDHSGGSIDGCYSIDEPRIRKLVRLIGKRGHKIGLHCSYNTFRDAEQTLKEARLLRELLEEEQIQQDEFGCRQHFLRWATPDTGRNLNAAGFSYDSTLGFADRPGFRCGTCVEFPMYDLVNRIPLKMTERPLVLMEGSIFGKQYMSMDYSHETLATMRGYKSVCLKYGGDFTLLWHNSHFTTREDRELYLGMI